MIVESKSFTLKNGQTAVFRSPCAQDATEMLDFLKNSTEETHFVMRYPEECTETAEQEEAFLLGLNASSSSLMIVCTIDGKIAGNCQLKLMNRRMKTRHRCNVAIGILRQYWGLGIGTRMFQEMFAIAKAQGAEQMELEYIEGNERGRGLYEKMGFTIVGERPDAYRLKDGTMLKEILMMRKL